MTFMDKLRALLAEADEETPDEETPDEETPDEETPDEETPDEETPDEETPGEVVEETPEQTPGADQQESAAEAELRQTIVEQAALIETLRNQVAALGGEVVEEEVEDEIAEDVIGETEEDVVAAFDEDYAKREAALAEIKEN